MRLTFLSDAHLQGADDPVQDALVAFLRDHDTDGVVLVGDVFEHWWGWPRAVYGAYVPVLAELHGLGRRGVPVWFVPGNRDFNAGPVLGELGVTVTPRFTAMVAGRRVVAVHGHRADRSRRQRTVRWLLESRATAATMRALGPGLGWRLSARVVRASREHPADLAWLLDAQRRLAARELREADVVLTGHAHAPGTERLGGGRWVSLGDWVEHRSFAVVDGGVHLYRWRGGRAEPVEGPPSRRLQQRERDPL